MLQKASGTAMLKFSSLLLGFVTSIVMARELGPEAFGRYVFIFSLASLVALPVGTALNQFVMRETARARAKGANSLIKGLLIRGHFWILSSSLIAFFLMWLVGDLLNNNLVQWAFLIIPLMALTALRSEVIRGVGLILKSQWPDMVLRPLIFLATVCGLAMLDRLTPISALLAYTLALSITFTILLLLSRLITRDTDYRQIEPQFDDARWLKLLPWFMALSGLGAVSNLSGSVILGVVNSDPSEVAAFQLSLSFAALIGLPLVVVNLVIGPQITSWWEKGDKAACIDLAAKMTGAATAVSVLAGTVVLYFPDIILRAFYGEDFVFAARSLQILVVSQIINVAFGPVGLVLALCGFERKALTGQAIGLVVSVAVSLMLVDTWGAMGAATGVLTGLVVWNVWMAVQVKRHWGGPYFFLLSGRFLT